MVAEKCPPMSQENRVEDSEKRPPLARQGFSSSTACRLDQETMSESRSKKSRWKLCWPSQAGARVAMEGNASCHTSGKQPS